MAPRENKRSQTPTIDSDKGNKRPAGEYRDGFSLPFFIDVEQIFRRKMPKVILIPVQENVVEAISQSSVLVCTLSMVERP